MWLAILIISPVAIVLLGHYVSRQLVRAVESLLPRRARAARIGRRIYLGIMYSVPALLLLWVAYVLIARPERNSAPSHWVLDYGLMIPFWFVTLWSLQCALLIAPVHLLAWGVHRARPGLPPRWERRRHGLVLLVAAVFAVYMPVRIAIDSRSLEVRQYEVGSAELPTELDGFRIALIADPQADEVTGRARLTQLVDAVNRERPDLVLIAGDIISRDPAYIEMAAEVLGRLRAPHGVVSTIGDHENFAYRDRKRSVREVREGLAAHGIAMLDNEVQWIEVGGHRLAIVVATDNYITPLGEDQARLLIARASAADFTAILTHQARTPLLDAARAASADLVLAGHTHGGQDRFWMPGFDLVAARIETPYITGHFTLGPTDLIVSSGLGTSVVPFRYRAPATAEIITLRRPNASTGDP
ncbi:MAG TPA: metallophosphoesterase [Kofleriaceae bacterium]|nr:metallophosphoesterase [Kofleriaceae bacterium]